MTISFNNHSSLPTVFQGAPDHFLQEWDSLRREKDPELFAEGLLHLARTLEASGDEVRAAGIFSAIANGNFGIDVSESVRRRASDRFELLSGRGSTAANSEYLLRHFCQNAADPAAVFAMGTAGAVFRMTRLATLARLGAKPASSFLASKWIAPSIASLTGFAFEVPAFSLAHRIGSGLLVRDGDEVLSGFSKELASAYLTLGGLRLGGMVSASLSRGFYGAAGARNPSIALSRHLLNQSGMFAGILLGQTLEIHAGLRRASSGASMLIDSAATFLHFHVGGRLARHALGPRMAAWEQGLDRRFAALSAPQNPIPNFVSEFYSPSLALELGGIRMEAAGARTPRAEPMMMIGRLNASGESAAEKSPAESLREELRQRIEALRSRAAGESNSLRISRWTQEADWLKNAPQDDLVAFFRESLVLRGFYTRNIVHGGRDGLLWLKGMEARLFQKIRRIDEYRQFLHSPDSELPLFEFPNYFTPPSTLPEVGPRGASVISIQNAQNGLQQNLAYYRISDLFTIQDIVSVGKVAEYGEMLRRGEDFPGSVQVGFDARREGWYLMDGHHRVAAAFQKGRAYVLASSVRSFMVAQAPQRIQDLRHVSREEYEAIAARNQYGTGLSESSLATEFESLESLPSGSGGSRAENQAVRPQSSWFHVLRRFFLRR